MATRASSTAQFASQRGIDYTQDPARTENTVVAGDPSVPMVRTTTKVKGLGDKANQTLQIIEQAAKLEGVDAAIFKAFAKNETAYGAAADRQGSKYQGVMQMGEDAAKDVGLALNKRGDPLENIRGAMRYAKQNAAALGIPVTLENAGVLYAAHQQGAGAVKKWLKADPMAPIASVIGDRYARANGMAGMTVAQAKAKWIDGTQKVANQWAEGTTIGDSVNIASATGSNTTNSYSQQAIGVAQKLADMNRASMGTFGANDQDKTQGIVSMGAANNTSMNRQADVLGQIQRNWSNFETNPDGSKVVGADGQPVKKGIGSRLYDLTFGSGAASLDNITQQQIQGDVLKSVTNAQNMAKQQQALNAGTVVDPKTYEQAGITAVNQQQADQTGAYQTAQTANAAATLGLNRDKLNADIAQQEFLNKYVTEDRNAKKTAELRAAGTAAELDAQMQTAAKQLNVSIPKGLGYDQALALITDPVQKASFATLVLNNGSMGNNLYDAVKLGRTPGVSDAIRNTAMKYGEFVDNVLSSPAARARLDGVLNEETGQRAGGITDPMQRDIVARDLVAGALKGVSEGTVPADIKYSAMNPYSVAARDDAIYNGVTFAKGLNPTIVANPVSAIRVAWREGASATEIAKTYQDIAGNIDTRLGDAKVALPKVQLRVQIGTQGNGAPRYADMTKPTDVAIIMKRYAMEEAGAPKSSIWENIKGGAAELGDNWNETSFLLRKSNKY